MQYARYAPSEVYYTHSAATGLIAGLFEVSGESRDFESEPAGACQGCLQGNGVHRFSHCMKA